MVEVGSIAIASITDANYCPDTYSIMFVVKRLLTIMFIYKEAAVLVDYM